MKRSAVGWLVLALAAAALAALLFPRAFPILAIEGRVDRAVALQRADSFIVAHRLAPDSARRAIEFGSDDSLRTFIELRGGGKDSLDALLASHDVEIFHWAIRAFVPGEAREARIRLSPDGRIVSARQILPDSLVRPAVDEVRGRTMADSAVVEWLGEPLARWPFLASSYAVRSPSGRIDRTYTYERTDRRIAGAPIRLDVVIAGDMVAEARTSLVTPESFGRRYAEMRSANLLLSMGAQFGMLALVVAAMIALRRYAREHQVRWRGPVAVGAVGGVLMTAALLNQLPASWMLYDTAGSAELHRIGGFAIAIAGGAGTFLLLVLTLAAAEALTRQAFPWHLDWWKLWQYRGTREVAARVGGGYVMAAVGFAYVTTFYLVTRSAFGWWVPSELIDDPNQVATPLPWIAGLSLALQAGISEEALFRAVPLSLIALWAARRDDRDRWMALGVVGTALLFGFAHSDYPSWPAYSRGLEIFLEACVWGVLFLRFGILVPVISHFLYDLVLFGLFATGGSGAPYRISATILILALLAPLLSVAWAWVRQGGWRPLGEDATFAAWSPVPVPARAAALAPERVRSAGDARTRTAALVVFALGVVTAATITRAPMAGPAFTAGRDRAAVVGDSMLRARGVDPLEWRRLVAVGHDTVASWRRFLVAQDAESLAAVLAPSYAVPAWWVVRYVRPDTALEQRAEEWRLRVFPDGRPMDVRHIIREEAPATTVEADAVRQLAMTAARASTPPSARLHEAEFAWDSRPARRDATVTYVDSSITLPAGATARAWVTVAGDEVLSVRRGVKLPEAFLRDARRRDELSLAAAAAFGMPAVGLLFWAVVRARRRPFVAPDDLSRRTVLVSVAVLMALTLAGSLLSLPTRLAQYDTSVPWSNFVASTIGLIVLGLAGVLVTALFWFLANGMRRRVGIPLVAGQRLPGLPDDVFVGLGLAGLSTSLGLVDRLLERGEMAAAPTTMLDQAIPVLGPVVSLVPGVITLVLAVSIPLLAIRGFDDRRQARWILGGLVLALFAGAGAAFTYAAGVSASPWRGAWSAVNVLIMVAAIARWGGVSVLSWFVAALASMALRNIESVTVAATTVERAAYALSFLVTLSLLAVAWLISRRPPVAPQSATDHSTSTVSELPLQSRTS